MMFTPTFTRDHHIEELRAELRAAVDADEARTIRAELSVMLPVTGEVCRQVETPE
jgi:hypothetical protein